MASILIIYSTTDGHTLKICQRLQHVMELEGHAVALLPVTESVSLDLCPFDKVVIGASIRYGKHSPLVTDFINSNKELLDSKPNAFFSVNVVARKPEKSRPEANPYLQRFLKRITWHPSVLAVFAGRIDYPSYAFMDRLMIRLIMWMTKGPTDPKAVVEFTNWKQVEEFARVIGRM